MPIPFPVFSRRKPRRYATWQIELTTRCNLRCTMCVKEACRWERRDMTEQGFAAILPYLDDVENVVLEGWGESLLHPYLPEAVRLVKERGPRAGFVTSGLGLDAEKARLLVASGLDFLGISFSGALAATHNSIRVNSDFDCLVDTVRMVRELKGAAGRPRLHLVYLILKENVDELPAIVGLANGLGIEEVVALNIVQVSSPGQDRDRAFVCEGESPYRKVTDEARRLARRLKVNLAMPRLEGGSVAVCSENPLRNLYISAEGEVAPCVYLHPPVPSPFPRFFCGEEQGVEKVSFGNIFNESFEGIWNSESYRAFRYCFEERERRWREVYASLFEARLPQAQALPDPPLSCRTCHKMLGL